MDISADLQELARCPVGLVSAGVKSILDIGRSAFREDMSDPLLLNFVLHLQDFGIPCMFALLEYSSFLVQYEQETLGVPVVTYGETQDFPAFYSPSSGFKVRLRFSSADYTNALNFLRVQSPWQVNDPASAANILCKWSMTPLVVIPEDSRLFKSHSGD
jgi:pseudouridylate synthase / pseudouridine kinase